jgi:hypothetical protein
MPKPIALMVERLIGALHRFLEAPRRFLLAMRPDVAIVDENDVEPVEPHAQERMLDRAHRAVIGIIEARRVRVSAGEARRHHVAARLGRLGERGHDAANLGRDQDLVALGAP